MAIIEPRTTKDGKTVYRVKAAPGKFEAERLASKAQK
jgi:hypothetical protein